MSSSSSSSSSTAIVNSPSSWNFRAAGSYAKRQACALSYNMGRKITSIKPEEAIQFGITTAKVTGAYFVTVAAAKVIDYSWELTLYCATSIVGSTLDVPITLLAVGAGGALVITKWNQSKKSAEEQKPVASEYASISEAHKKAC